VVNSEVQLQLVYNLGCVHTIKGLITIPVVNFGNLFCCWYRILCFVYYFTRIQFLLNFNHLVLIEID